MPALKDVSVLQAQFLHELNQGTSILSSTRTHEPVPINTLKQAMKALKCGDVVLSKTTRFTGESWRVDKNPRVDTFLIMDMKQALRELKRGTCVFY